MRPAREPGGTIRTCLSKRALRMKQSHCRKAKFAPVFSLEEPRQVPMQGDS